MYCSQCGKQLQDGDRFCPSCGASQTGEEKQTYTPPQYNPQCAAPQQVQHHTNTLAIVGFVLSFFCAIAGLICSIIGFQKSKELDGEGRGLATAGIAISVAAMVIGLITSIIIITYYVPVLIDPYY
ncbi:MAG: zinc-ribbon domain-containing protein [Candidatus Gallimonas sp.]